MSKVLVASLSLLKISAVTEVVSELLQDNKVKVQGVNTESGINEQPVGLDGVFCNFLASTIINKCIRNIQRGNQ